VPRQAELQNEFSWSLSRDSTFSACLRQYYFHYYGSWGGWRHDAPADVKELYVMKNLQTMPMWTGSVVHQVAHDVIKGFKVGRPVQVEVALARTRDRMQRDWQDSARGRYRNRPNRICGLLEHYYGGSVPTEAPREAMILAEGCVRRLYGSHSYETMRELGPAGIVECEELNTLSVAGVKVWVSPDVILREAEERLVIVDWKTGTSSQRAETKRQLSIYGIYALQAHGGSAHELIGVEEDLCTGETHVQPLKDWALEEARRYMEHSMRRMLGLLESRGRNVALIRDFPLTDNLSACVACRFRRACDRG
jgi:hypothetical protein